MTAAPLNGILMPLCLMAICLAGCDRSSSVILSTQSASETSKQVLNDFENKSGLVLPEKSVLLSAGDGGGREASHQFYEWVVYSPSPINLPVKGAPGVREYVNLPLDNTVKFVQTRVKDRTITGASLAIHTSWQRDPLGFSAELVRTDTGDYVIFNQGRVK